MTYVESVGVVYCSCLCVTCISCVFGCLLGVCVVFWFVSYLFFFCYVGVCGCLSCFLGLFVCVSVVV